MLIGARRAPAANAMGRGRRSSGHAPGPPGVERMAGSRTPRGRLLARQWAPEGAQNAAQPCSTDA